MNVVDLGVAPTPAVAWFANADWLPAAVLSASHNPWQDNGIKLFAAGGRKLTDDQQNSIQALIDGGLTPDPVVPTVEPGSIDRYLDAVVASLDGRTFEGTSVVLDCAHGAASTTAERVFQRLGADVLVVANSPDGRNINDGVGSTHPHHVAEAVIAKGAAAGFAFDGDADRLVACGADGSIIDGDRIIAMSAIDRKATGRLRDNTVVITVMANLGFRVAMTDAGIDMVETPVGDRHVLEALDVGGFSLGGEQSGHVIHRDLATTGDGVLAAVQLFDAALRRNIEVGTWAATVMMQYPQVLENVRVTSSIDDPTTALAAAIRTEENLLGDAGRVLVRASGTEPLIRVMVEAADAGQAKESASRLVDAVHKLATPAGPDDP
jgi:phosphoglucosamine mutase